MKYPCGSVPYTPDNDPVLRVKRLICCAFNHRPRFYTGSWCFGYGYVCSRCHMYADPVPEKDLDAMGKAVNALPPEQQQNAAAWLSGGGPIPRSRRR